MRIVASVLAWASLIGTTIVLGQMMNSAADSYFQRPLTAATAPVVSAAIPQFDDQFLDAKDRAPATVGGISIAVPPDRASERRLGADAAP